MYKSLMNPLCIAASCMLSGTAHAQTLLEISLSWSDYSSLEKTTTNLVSQNLAPPLIVSANGKISGTVPGVIQIPSTNGAVVVEVGLSDLHAAPLYSFVVIPTAVEKTTSVAETNLEVDASKGRQFLNILPTRRKQIKPTSVTENLISVSLDASPYAKLSQHWTQTKSFHKGGLPIEVPQQQNRSLEGYKHVVYDDVGRRPKFLSETDTPVWSGAVSASWGAPIPEETWLVRSLPSQAKIRTHLALVGDTDTHIPVRRTGQFYLLIEKPGFASCPYDLSNLSLQGTRYEYSCTLIPVPLKKPR